MDDSDDDEENMPAAEDDDDDLDGVSLIPETSGDFSNDHNMSSGSTTSRIF